MGETRTKHVESEITTDGQPVVAYSDYQPVFTHWNHLKTSILILVSEITA